ncbi:hypothetical protein C8J55DRAFT_494230 [Lentinula edodes]|uniref:Uncharacterized protein n=1 Tax=Lentinula lateritia TaxID=40482 RepID=A0A9W8ZQY0_9AGAR|nr:hypothetical protein C8J55DRAFT_494230 [Lentinula edodes]
MYSSLSPQSDPIVDFTAVFKNNLFKGKVLLSTGGAGSLAERQSSRLCGMEGKQSLSDEMATVDNKLRMKSVKLREVTASPRRPTYKRLKGAVERAVETFGRIDFVIWLAPATPTKACTEPRFVMLMGAAANSLSTISGLSENALKTVMEIDTPHFLTCEFPEGQYRPYLQLKKTCTVSAAAFLSPDPYISIDCVCSECSELLTLIL